MKNLKVALLQLMPEGTLEGNLQKGLEYCRKAKEMGADLALFPEMWSTGYNIPENIEESGVPATSEESLEVGWFLMNEVIQMMGDHLYKTRITNMLSKSPNMFCYAFIKEPFSLVVSDEFKIGL